MLLKNRNSALSLGWRRCSVKVCWKHGPTNCLALDYVQNTVTDFKLPLTSYFLRLLRQYLSWPLSNSQNLYVCRPLGWKKKKNPRTEQHDKLTANCMCVVQLHMQRPWTRGFLYFHPHPSSFGKPRVCPWPNFHVVFWDLFRQGLNFWTSAFIWALSSFNENPTKSVQPDTPSSLSDQPLYRIRFLIFYRPPGDVWSPGPPATRILLGQFS